MAINNDVVVRTVYYKYLHPKEAFISKGCTVNAAFGTAVARLHHKSKVATAAAVAGNAGIDVEDRKPKGADSVELAYPRGATLNVSKPALPLVSSGFVSYPINRPIAAVVEVRPAGSSSNGAAAAQASFKGAAAAAASSGSGGGRIAVIGSAEMLSDEWIGKEANSSLAEVAVRWLMRVDKLSSGNAAQVPRASDDDDESGGSIDRFIAAIASSSSSSSGADGGGGGGGRGGKGKGGGGGSSGPGRGPGGGSVGPGDVNGSGGDRDISEPYLLPDTASLADRLRSCLQESEPLPRDFTKLFDTDLFSFNTRLIPEAVALYNTLNVKHAPLTLIAPQFESPLPPLQPAVFPPTMREPPPPGETCARVCVMAWRALFTLCADAEVLLLADQSSCYLQCNASPRTGLVVDAQHPVVAH